MPPIVSSIEIARPPDEVFSYVTDPLRFPNWQSDVVSVRMEGHRPPGVGSRFTTTRRIGGTERTMTQEITEISPPGAGPLTASMGRSGQPRTSPSIRSTTARGHGSRSHLTSRGTGSASRSCRPSGARR
jgi:uncharacterized protein YndB with AHSA1/START domain